MNYTLVGCLGSSESSQQKSGHILANMQMYEKLGNAE